MCIVQIAQIASHSLWRCDFDIAYRYVRSFSEEVWTVNRAKCTRLTWVCVVLCAREPKIMSSWNSNLIFIIISRRPPQNGRLGVHTEAFAQESGSWRGWVNSWVNYKVIINSMNDNESRLRLRPDSEWVFIKIRSSSFSSTGMLIKTATNTSWLDYIYSGIYFVYRKEGWGERSDFSKNHRLMSNEALGYMLWWNAATFNIMLWFVCVGCATWCWWRISIFSQSCSRSLTTIITERDSA